MPINIKKSINYVNQRVKFKDLGLGGEIRLLAFAVPPIVLSYTPGVRYFYSCAVIDPSGTERF